MLLVIVLGIVYFKAANYSPVHPARRAGGTAATGHRPVAVLAAHRRRGSTFGWYGLLAAASLVFFAFIGFDVVATAAEETKNPQKAVPRGILGSLAIVTVLYVAVTLVLTGMVPYTSSTRSRTARARRWRRHSRSSASTGRQGHLDRRPGRPDHRGDGAAARARRRVLFAMSRDGLLPRGWPSTGKHGTPVRITVIVGVLVAVAAGFFPIGTLEEMVNVGTLFAFVLVSAGVIVLRKTRPDLPRGFRVPLVPLVPILAVLACLWLMLNLTAVTWLRFVIWMALGVVVYFAYSRRHSLLGRKGATAVPVVKHDEIP